MKLNIEQQQLVEDNLKLVYYIVNKYFAINFGKVDKEDLIGEGVLCLCRCALYYNKDKGIQFSTYACRSIKKHLVSFLQKYYDYPTLELEDGFIENVATCEDSYNYNIREEIEEFLEKYLLEKEVKILMAYYFDGKNTHVIAEELGYKHASSVNSMRLVILNKLRKIDGFKEKYIEYFI